ncbi:MAG: ABC transporter substrate-binding protein [Thermomicrobiales bacterium]|nr:ABC transporter substrate-binding protein [Thermomicrobiales bacterium]
MTDPRTQRFLAATRTGRLSRRAVLETGLRLGVATPLLTSLVFAAPEAKGAPQMAAVPARQDGASSGTFTNIITVGTEDFDPHYSYATLSSTIAMCLYDMLIRYKGDSTTEIEPMLAESWEANEDQSVVTFKIRPDVTFHDGTVCDAQAVKDSYTRWIELGGAPVNVITRFVESPDQMVAVDATTLRFDLGRPQPLFVYAMASQYGPSVLSPTAIKEHATAEDPYAHEFFKADGVGTGPYRLISNSLNEGLVFERFTEYRAGWEGNHFDRIIFRVVPEEATRRQLLEQGDADAAAFNLTVDNIEALRTNDRVTVVEYPSTANQWVIMNVPRLKTVEARKGLSYAFPYDDVQNAVFKGLLKRTGPLADSVRGYDPDVFLYPTDLAKAKELLLQGGFQEGDVFEYMFDSNDPREATVGQLFQANVQQIGFDLDLQAVDYATLESSIFGDAPTEEKPHMYGGWGWWPDYNDAWNQLAPNFTAANIGGGGSNAGAYDNARFEEIMAEAEHFTSEEEYDALMKEAQNILTEQDPPAIYYGQIIYYTVIGKDIQGYVPNPLYLSSFDFWGLSRSPAT